VDWIPTLHFRRTRIKIEHEALLNVLQQCLERDQPATTSDRGVQVA
jgi:hypothetical protein